MARIERFEDISGWQRARELVGLIYRLTSKPRFTKDWGLKEQIQRAAVSVMANIAEGFERHSDREFVQFLYNARGSSGEVRSLLYVACDLGYITEVEFKEAFGKAEETSRAIFGLIRYLNPS